ncbi:MAG: shikimate kinase [Deltaproteobacteria bacterium]|jgi:shikimate kinase|nr:shikimate kinase [Deltaproteobacteria bacterium]MBW2499855.1 shikimate kinase [Deltaproteobacteria bacterium]
MPPREPHPELLCNLALIGGRGCGKSSIAKRIARRNRNFMLFSLDALIRYEAGGLSIPEIVEGEGWPGFRERERAVVEKVSAFEREALLDCGGGVVVDLDEDGEEIYSESKVQAIRRHGLVVYLRRDPDYLLERIGGDPNRPALSETRSFFELMERRDPWYRAAADLVLECGTREKSDLTELVLDWYYESQSTRSSSSLRQEASA